MSRLFASTPGTDAVNVAATARLNNNNNWTAMGWFNPTTSTVDNTFFAKSASDESTWNYYGSIASGFPVLSFYGNTTTSATALSQTDAGVISLGVWQHITISYSTSDGVIRLYYNGASVGAPVSTNVVTDSLSAPWTIGNFGGPITGDNGFTFDGLIAQVRFYDSQLSSGQITTIMNSSDPNAAGLQSHLVTYLTFTNNVGAGPEPDASGNGNVGVFTGTSFSSNNPPISPSSPFYSVPDCRNFGIFPNSSRTVNQTKIYDVQTSDNPAVPGTDSRASGAPTASGTYPQNSRTPGTFGPGE